ncbi:MAG TPA: hydrogenase maturation protease [Cyclobacteriaceae bacterium]|nr:hydrogenase maturation protease [Cyclobacteriaceae bacterium]HPW61665.1 hydrogenase maturation protease [Cyclobacteriaceae bacterium]
MTSSPVLILGIGNYLMGDEGLGVHFVNQLKEEIEPGLADIIDGGTAGFQLMEYLESYPYVILIDATLDGRPAGTIQKIKPRFSKDFPSAMSTHEIGLKDLVEGLLLLGKLPDIHLFIMSIEKVQPLSTLLSPEIERSLPELKRQVITLAKTLSSEVTQPA